MCLATSVSTFIIFINLLFLVVFAVEFRNIPGYFIVADTFNGTASTRVKDCETFCLQQKPTNNNSSNNKFPCIGFSFNGSYCNSFAKIRNILENPKVLNHFILLKPNITSKKNYTKVEQYILTNAYNSILECPDGFEFNKDKKNCSSTIEKIKCLEYAPIFKAQWNENATTTTTKCEMPSSMQNTLILDIVTYIFKILSI